jgi:mannose-6-phosphate isomerase-like protein (cupin superfamily)
MSIHIVAPSNGEAIDLGPSRIRILEDGSRTGHQIGIAEIWLAPGYGGPPQHLHRKHDENFYVLSGTMEFISGTERLRASVGTLVTVPIGVPHTFSNPDPDETATCLFTSTPDLYINYFRDLAAAMPGGLSHDAILQIMSKYATEGFRP